MDDKIIEPLQEIITEKFIELNAERIEDAERVENNIQEL